MANLFSLERMKAISFFVLGLCALSGALSPVIAAQPSSIPTITAFKAREIAQKSLAPEVKNNLIQILGPRSDSEITPDTWKFVFFEQGASQCGRLVTVRGTSVIEIRDGYFELDKMRMFAYKTDEIIDPKRFKIDSDKALETVMKTAQLQNVKLSSVIFSLTKVKELGDPVWKLQIRADRGGQEVDIGYARVSAESGGVIEMKLTPEKLKKS